MGVIYDLPLPEEIDEHPEMNDGDNLIDIEDENLSETMMKIMILTMPCHSHKQKDNKSISTETHQH